MKRNFFRAALLAASIPVLSGCVAAIVPVVASGAFLGKSQIDSNDDDEREARVELEQVAPPAPVLTAGPTEQLSEPLEAVEATMGPAEELPPSRANGVDGFAVVTDAKSDAPITQPRANMAPTGPSDFRAYDAMYSYVESQARRDPVQTPRQSAILAAPGMLSPKRTDCSIRPPAVLLDMDPGEQTFDARLTPLANPALSQILASLRLQEVEIFWISQQAAVEAGAIRKILITSNLDPQGRDKLLLMRRADDRKQARRKELSETHCLVAISGDTRADFDELYVYLKDKSSAQSLEELIGAGWFITPLALTAAIPLAEGQ